MEVGMGLLDQLGGSLKDALSSAVAAEKPGLISALLAKTNLGNLQGIVDQLQKAGLGDQIKSWLSDGPNMKITPDQIRAALSSDQVRQLAQQFGVPIDDALKLLADHLPTAVDQASPNGKIQKV
jgi:uncharacterized protein YidB (DUF937 family)